MRFKVNVYFSRHLHWIPSVSNINTDKTGCFDFYTYSVFTHNDLIHSLIKMGQYLISDEQVGCV